MTLNDHDQASTSTSRPCAGEQVLSNTTQVNVLFETVADNVRKFGSAVRESKKSLKTTQIRALSSIYELHMWLAQNPEEKSEFYKQHNIERHHLAKYECQPLVKHIIYGQEQFQDIANKQTVWSGIIDLAKERNIDPDGFSEFISTYKGGFDQAYRDALKQAPDSTYKQNRQKDIRYETDFYNKAFSPVSIDVGEFKGGMSIGKNLVIVEVTKKGDCSIVAALEKDPSQVKGMFDKHLLIGTNFIRKRIAQELQRTKM